MLVSTSVLAFLLMVILVVAAVLLLIPSEPAGNETAAAGPAEPAPVAPEAAVPEAKELLVEAVRDMSVADAQQILTGGDDSVTQYFRGATQDQLRERFLPIVKEKTDTLGLAGQYNKLAGAASRYGLLSAEEANLEDYVTGKALDGLYFMIAQEERAIRKDPLGQASDLLKRVFGPIGK